MNQTYNQTYEQLKPLAELYEGNLDYTNEALEEAVTRYQQNQSPEIFAFVYCRVYKITLNIIKRFSNVEHEDKISYSTEILHKSMMSYDPSKNESVQMYYSSCYSRTLINIANANEADKRKANVNCLQYPTTDGYDLDEANVTVSALSEPDNNLGKVELLKDLTKLDLTPNELAYCKLLVTLTGNTLKNSEIAQEIGISRAAVTQIKERLKLKLKPLFT